MLSMLYLFLCAGLTKDHCVQYVAGRRAERPDVTQPDPTRRVPTRVCTHNTSGLGRVKVGIFRRTQIFLQRTLVSQLRATV